MAAPVLAAALAACGCVCPPAGPAPVEGRVVDPRGVPLPSGAVLVVRTRAVEGSPLLCRIELPPDGAFRTEPLEEAATCDLLVSGIPGRMGARAAGVRAGTGGLVLLLEEGRSLAGRIVGQDGEPLPSGVPVSAEAPEAAPEEPGRAASTFTEEGGRFSLDHLCDLPFRVTVGEEGSDVPPAAAGDGARPGGAPLLLRVGRGWTLAGRLLDPRGRVVTDAERVVVRVPGGAEPLAGTADLAKGQFRFPALPACRVEVVVVRGGVEFPFGPFDLPAVDVVLETLLLGSKPRRPAASGGPGRKEPPPEKGPPAKAPVPRRLIRGTRVAPGPIEGRVLDSEGRPIAGAEVEVLRLDDETGKPVEGFALGLRTDAEGRFVSTDLEAAFYRIRVEARGQRPGEAKSVPSATRPEIRLEPGLLVAGVAVDAATGKPAAGVRVSMRARPPVQGFAFATTGEDGSFRLGYPPPGTYDLLFGAEIRPGRSLPDNPGDFFTKEVKGVENGTEGLRVELQRGLAIEGILVGGDGEPASEETLKWTEVTLSVAGGEGVGAHPIGLGVRRPGPRGEFRFGTLAPGRYRLAASYWNRDAGVHFPFDPVEADAGAASVRIPVPVGGGIAGRVADGEGRPLEGVMVEVLVSGSDDLNPLGAFPSGPDGSFRTPPLDATKAYDLLAPFRDRVPGEAAGVRPGAEGVLLVPGPGASIAGVVLDETGSPAPAGVQVNGMPVGVPRRRLRYAHRSAATGPGGAFTLEGLRPGAAYLLGVQPGGEFLPVETSGTVAAGTEGVVVRALRGVPLAGRVLDPGGKPAFPLGLRAVPGDAKGLPSWLGFHAMTDTEGKFRFPGLPRGKVRLKAGFPREERDLGEFEAPSEGMELRLDAK